MDQFNDTPTYNQWNPEPPKPGDKIISVKPMTRDDFDVFIAQSAQRCAQELTLPRSQ